MRAIIPVAALAAALLGIHSSHAQAPAAGTGGGGPVNPSASDTRTATGKTPPGTPDAQTAAGTVARDTAGQSVVGKTTTPATAVPGSTSGQDSGLRK